MDGLLKQIFPEGKERWIKVLYTDPEKASKVVRFKTATFNTDELGFEVVSIGATDEYMPQIEALVKLKADILRDPRLMFNSEIVDSIMVHIDNRVAMVLGDVILKP